jgi:hypothetical protein
MAFDAAQFSETGAPGAPQLPVTYYTSRRKALLLLLGCLAFVALGCWLITIRLANGEAPFKAQLAGFSGIVFFGLCAVMPVYFLIWKAWIVTLDKEGILIRWYSRRIAWGEIAEIDLVYQHVPARFGVGPQEIKWIGVFLKDTRSYYASLGARRRRLASRLEVQVGTPILITCSLLPIAPDTLVAWMNEYRAKYSR